MLAASVVVIMDGVVAAVAVGAIASITMALTHTGILILSIRIRLLHHSLRHSPADSQGTWLHQPAVLHQRIHLLF